MRVSVKTDTNVDVKVSTNAKTSVRVDEDVKILEKVSLKVEGGEVNVKADASPLCVDVGVGLGTIIDPSHIPIYEGPYEATPRIDSQIFETYGKRMRDDFTVLGVPYEEVSNPQGGETVIIAFE